LIPREFGDGRFIEVIHAEAQGTRSGRYPKKSVFVVLGVVWCGVGLHLVEDTV
jgi:hypothetical protein